jgi:hypothetical protein
MMKMPWVTPGARMEVEAERLALHTLPANTQIEAPHQGRHSQHLSLGSAVWLVPRWRSTTAPTLAVEGGEVVAVVHVLHHQEQVAGREIDERAAVAANWMKDEVVCGGGVVSATPQCKSQCPPPTHPLHTPSRASTVASACAHELEELDLEPSDDPLVVGPDLVLAVHVLAGPGLPGGGGRGRQRTTKTT